MVCPRTSSSVHILMHICHPVHIYQRIYAILCGYTRAYIHIGSGGQENGATSFSPRSLAVSKAIAL